MRGRLVCQRLFHLLVREIYLLIFLYFWVAFWANSYSLFSSNVDVVMIVMKTFTKVFRCEGINNLYAIAAITKRTGTFIDSSIHYLFLIF